MKTNPLAGLPWLADTYRRSSDIVTIRLRLIADLVQALRDLPGSVRIRVLLHELAEDTAPRLLEAPALTCVSLWNPWAALVAAGEKWIETRAWPTRHRGTIGIHAARKNDEKKSRQWLDHIKGNGWTPRTLRSAYLLEEGHALQGRLLAVATLHDVVPTDVVLNKRPGPVAPLFGPDSIGWTNTAAYVQDPKGGVLLTDGRESYTGDLAPGRFAWLLKDVRAVVDPPEVKGHQGLWRYEPSRALLTVPV